MHAREWLRIEQEKISRPVARGIDVTTKSISTLSLPRLLDYKIEVVIEDLFKTQHDAEEALQAVGTRLEFLIPVTEEAQALSIE